MRATECNGQEFHLAEMMLGVGVRLDLAADPGYYGFVEYLDRKEAGSVWKFRTYHLSTMMVDGERDNLVDAVQESLHILAGRYIFDRKHRTREAIAREEVQIYLEGLI